MEATQKLAHPREGERLTDETDLPIEPSAPRSRRSLPVPRPPESLEEAGLSEDFVAGLVLKALYVRGAVLGFELFDMLALPMALLDEVIRQLQDLGFVEVHSTKGPSRGEYVFKLTGAGRKRALEELEVSRYVGPAPVAFDDFLRWIELQAIERASVSEDELRLALDGIVLPDSMLELLGPAINSGRSLFLYGDPGNGKTLLAERIARVFGEKYYVPYSVLVDGSVMIVHDPVHHSFGPGDDEPGGPVREDEPEAASGDMRREIFRSIPNHDRRYAEARRPVVITGGELTLEQLDLQWDPMGRMYQAPPQLKAAGGVLVIDDLGRQRVPVRDLLNRWVVPLEHRQDYLTLRSGRKIVVPFDSFVIFSTNLEPRALGDEAFLRRIHYKIEVPDPDRAEYERIFRICCQARDIDFEEDALTYLFAEFYGNGAIQPRRCHPRDVLDHVQDLAEYRSEPARLSASLLEQACRSYFLPSG
jgi:predicted ATPase with chaperone activity